MHRAGGGVSHDGKSWIACRPNFFLPGARALTPVSPLDAATPCHRPWQGALKFFGDHAGLSDIDAFRAFLKPLHRTDWVVYARRPFASPDQVPSYLTRYTHRVAIANSRLVAFEVAGSPSNGRIIGVKAKTATAS